MKFNALLSFLPVVLAVAGTNEGDTHVEARQSVNAVTDELLFSVTLPEFTRRRNARDPSYLDWLSDDCTWAPENPYGYPFKPACQRLDFGYRNYKRQIRFTVINKLRIDDKFRADLYYQCDISNSGPLCRSLADVYYRGARSRLTRRSEPGVGARNVGDALLTHEYERAVADYEAALHEAQKKGEIPALN